MATPKLNKIIQAQIKRQATYSSIANFLLDDKDYLILNQYKTLKKSAKSHPDTAAREFSNPVESREHDSVSQLLTEIEDSIESHCNFANWAISLIQKPLIFSPQSHPPRGL